MMLLFIYHSVYLVLFIYLNGGVVYLPQLFTLCCCLFYSCFDGYNATVLAYGQVRSCPLVLSCFTFISFITKHN